MADTVTIDLFAPNLPGSISEESFVQQKLKKQLIEEIKDLGNKEEKTGEQNYQLISEAGRQVFFIDGTRGAGKTTFLNGIIEHFSSSNNKGSILALRSIDPTKLPTIEPILVTVIAQLNGEVQKKLKDCRWDQDQRKKTSWEQALKSISKTISLLNSKEYSPDFFDDALELHARLSNSTDGMGLAEQFSNLLDHACGILGCGAIIIAFDDIDTQFSTGWSVLEAIRMYFDSPRLIVLMTGDLRLYSQLIRGKQYENYSHILLNQEQENEQQGQRSEMVDHLEQQYLLKLLPVHRRYILKNLYQMLHHEVDCNIKVKISDTDDSIPLELVLAIQNMLMDGLNLKEGKNLDLYVNEILQQPIRLVSQLLQRYYQQINNPKNNKTNCARIFNNAIRNTMLSSIYQAGLTYDNTDSNINTLCKDIFTFTLQDKDTGTGFYLRPQSESEVLRNSAIYLASKVSEATNGSLWKSLHLMMAGCGSITLIDPALDSLSNTRFLHIRHKSFIEEYISYIGLGRNESLSHWASRSHAALAPISTNSKLGIYPGTLRLRQNSKDYERTRDTKNNQLANLAIELSSSDMLGNQRITLLSVLNLIASITDLLHESERENFDLKDTLYQLASRATCSLPTWLGGNRRDPETDFDERDDLNQIVPHIEISDTCIEIISAWLSTVRETIKNIKPSAILLGKIWTRFYYNIDKIASDHKSILRPATLRNTNAANIMRFNVIAFLNSILIEESIHHISVNNNQSHENKKLTITGNRSNPVKEIDFFTNRLNDICESIFLTGDTIEKSQHEMQSRLPIFYSMISCPFIHAFIMADGITAHNSNAQKSLITNINQIISYEINGKRYDAKSTGIKNLKSAEIVASPQKKEVSINKQKDILESAA